jgi:thiol-disulfide isomerase/thioredoxin
MTMRNEDTNNSIAAPARFRGLWIWALSALIGFAAVYFTLGRPDNAALTEPPAAAPANDQASGSGSSASSKLTAFVVRNPPEPVPNITFQNAAGDLFNLSNFKGKTVLLNLWATWCAPCREEMPSLDRLQKALGGDKFEVVAVSLDLKGTEAARKFLAEVKAENLKLYVDPTAKQGNALKLIGMPTTILIDRQGRELGRLAGPAEWDSDDAKKLIETALK